MASLRAGGESASQRCTYTQVMICCMYCSSVGFAFWSLLLKEANTRPVEFVSHMLDGDTCAQADLPKTTFMSGIVTPVSMDAKLARHMSTRSPHVE